MDITGLTDYIVLLILGLCLCIGFCIRAWKRLPNKAIPTILAMIGVFFAIWLYGWEVSPEIILKGMMSGLAAVGLHQAFYQMIYKDRYEEVTDLTDLGIEEEDE